MNALNRNAAMQLFERVKSLATQPHNSWRCIYLNLSRRDERHNSGLRDHFITQALIDLLADMDGYIYLCEDGDIFILFQGPVKRIMAKLTTHFEDLQPRLVAEQQADSLFTIFDLSKYWGIFFNLCKAKSLQTA